MPGDPKCCWGPAWGSCTYSGNTAQCLGTLPGDTAGEPGHSLGTLHAAQGALREVRALHTPWGHWTLQGHSLRTLHTPGTRQAAWALHIPGASELTGDTADCLGTPNTPGQGILHVSPKMCMPSPLSRCTELLNPSLHSSCSPALIPGLPQRNGVKLVCPMALSPFRAAVPWLK